MSKRIAVFGDKESIYGFAALGLDTYYYEPTADNVAAFRKLCQSQSYSIIYITEAAAADLEKEIDKYRSEPSPAIILIPGVTGNTGERSAVIYSTIS